LTLPFTVYTLGGEECFCLYLFNEQFRVIFKSRLMQLSSREVALQILSFAGPYWKPSASFEVFGASADSVSSFR